MPNTIFIRVSRLADIDYTAIWYWHVRLAGRGERMRHDIALIRTQGRAAMIKAQIDTARYERESLGSRGCDNESAGEWNRLIRHWKQELKELTGEVY
jgi:hypothetical protein